MRPEGGKRNTIYSAFERLGGGEGGEILELKRDESRVVTKKDMNKSI